MAVVNKYKFVYDMQFLLTSSIPRVVYASGTLECLGGTMVGRQLIRGKVKKTMKGRDRGATGSLYGLAPEYLFSPESLAANFS